MVTTVSNWTASLWTGIATAFTRLMAGIPTILGAIALLVIGWIIAGIIGGLITRLCRAIHVDTVADRIGVNNFLARARARLRASDVIGELFKWVIRLMFIEMAADQLGLHQITLTITAILAFIPNIIVAIVILGVGLFVAQLVAGGVRATASEAGMSNADALAKLASWAVMAFAIIAAINELNVAPIVVNTLYIGLVAALALALGLSFGLGGRDVAGRYAERWSSSLENNAQRLATTGTTTPTRATVETQGTPTRVTSSDSTL
ncbi:MAG: hypothetical protein JO165_04140 [Candidatus Eremiobacteraeota bacterium]|nr:hypothetical protein [Candidatus Eremiobacteraeota bacterium]